MSDIPCKKGDIVVAEFGYGERYLEVTKVGPTAVSVDCKFTGALKQVRRKISATSKEGKAVKRMKAAMAEVAAVRAELRALGVSTDQLDEC